MIITTYVIMMNNNKVTINSFKNPYNSSIVNTSNNNRSHANVFQYSVFQYLLFIGHTCTSLASKITELFW